jgi:hypothetical protein
MVSLINGDVDLKKTSVTQNFDFWQMFISNGARLLSFNLKPQEMF